MYGIHRVICMFQVDLLPMKTILCGSGDEELLVLHLHGISSGL